MKTVYKVFKKVHWNTEDSSDYLTNFPLNHFSFYVVLIPSHCKPDALGTYTKVVISNGVLRILERSGKRAGRN